MRGRRCYKRGMGSLLSAVGMVPFVLVWLAAAGVALVRWDRHPTVSTLVLVAAGMEVMINIARVLAPTLLASRGVEMRQMSTVYVALSLFSSVALTLVVVAAFAERGPGKTETPARPMPPEFK